MVWWPGKNIGRPQGGWIRNAVQNRNKLPLYDQDPTAPMQGFEDQAAQGNAALADARGAQGSAMGLLAARAQGQGPSVAQRQLAQAGAQNVSNQLAMAAQARGGNLASQARAGAAAGAAGAMGTQEQLATLRAQEQIAAQDAYANQANQMAGMGLQQAQFGIGQQGQYALGQRGLDLGQRQGNRDFGLGIAQAATAALDSAGAMGGMMSDERNKTDIRPGDMAASRAIGALDPVTFQYKSPEYGQPGTLPGILAQDMERTPEGAALVTNTPAGKVVDRDAGLGLALAASAEQEKRIRELEGMVAANGQGLGMSQYGSIGQAQPQAVDQGGVGVGRGGFDWRNA